MFTIRLTKSAAAAAEVFDITGRKVKTTTLGELAAGINAVELDISDLPAGVYIYKVTAGPASAARKMVVAR